MLFLGLGFVVGDRGLGLISIGLDSRVLEVVAIVTLALVLFWTRSTMSPVTGLAGDAQSPLAASSMVTHVTGRIASPSTLTMASVVQRLSTGARGCLGSHAGAQCWTWRHVPVIGFQARNSAIAWATGRGR